MLLVTIPTLTTVLFICVKSEKIKDEEEFFQPTINVEKHHKHHVSCYTGTIYDPISLIESGMAVNKCDITHYCIKNVKKSLIPGTQMIGYQIVKSCDVMDVCLRDGMEIHEADSSITYCCKRNLCNSVDFHNYVLSIILSLLIIFMFFLYECE